MFRAVAFLSLGLAALALSGCAALNLFGQTHTHTHHHQEGCDELRPRVEALESRITALEHHLSPPVLPSSPGF